MARGQLDMCMERARQKFLLQRMQAELENDTLPTDADRAALYPLRRALRGDPVLIPQSHMVAGVAELLEQLEADFNTMDASFCRTFERLTRPDTTPAALVVDPLILAEHPVESCWDIPAALYAAHAKTRQRNQCHGTTTMSSCGDWMLLWHYLLVRLVVETITMETWADLLETLDRVDRCWRPETGRDVGLLWLCVDLVNHVDEEWRVELPSSSVIVDLALAAVPALAGASGMHYATAAAVVVDPLLKMRDEAHDETSAEHFLSCCRTMLEPLRSGSPYSTSTEFSRLCEESAQEQQMSGSSVIHFMQPSFPLLQSMVVSLESGYYKGAATMLDQILRCSGIVDEQEKEQATHVFLETVLGHGRLLYDEKVPYPDRVYASLVLLLSPQYRMLLLEFLWHFSLRTEQHENMSPAVKLYIAHKCRQTLLELLRGMQGPVVSQWRSTDSEDNNLQPYIDYVLRGHSTSNSSRWAEDMLAHEVPVPPAWRIDSDDLSAVGAAVLRTYNIVVLDDDVHATLAAPPPLRQEQPSEQARYDRLNKDVEEEPEADDDVVEVIESGDGWEHSVPADEPMQDLPDDEEESDAVEVVDVESSEDEQVAEQFEDDDTPAESVVDESEDDAHDDASTPRSSSDHTVEVMEVDDSDELDPEDESEASVQTRSVEDERASDEDTNVLHGQQGLSRDDANMAAAFANTLDDTEEDEMIDTQPDATGTRDPLREDDSGYEDGPVDEDETPGQTTQRETELAHAMLLIHQGERTGIETKSTLESPQASAPPHDAGYEPEHSDGHDHDEQDTSIADLDGSGNLDEEESSNHDTEVQEAANQAPHELSVAGTMPPVDDHLPVHPQQSRIDDPGYFGGESQEEELSEAPDQEEADVSIAGDVKSSKDRDSQPMEGEESRGKTASQLSGTKSPSDGDQQTVHSLQSRAVEDPGYFGGESQEEEQSEAPDQEEADASIADGVEDTGVDVKLGSDRKVRAMEGDEATATPSARDQEVEAPPQTSTVEDTGYLGGESQVEDYVEPHDPDTANISTTQDVDVASNNLNPDPNDHGNQDDVVMEERPNKAQDQVQAERSQQSDAVEDSGYFGGESQDDYEDDERRRQTTESIPSLPHHDDAGYDPEPSDGHDFEETDAAKPREDDHFEVLKEAPVSKDSDKDCIAESMIPQNTPQANRRSEYDEGYQGGESHGNEDVDVLPNRRDMSGYEPECGATEESEQSESINTEDETERHESNQGDDTAPLENGHSVVRPRPIASSLSDVHADDEYTAESEVDLPHGKPSAGISEVATASDSSLEDAEDPHKEANLEGTGIGPRGSLTDVAAQIQLNETHSVGPNVEPVAAEVVVPDQSATTGTDQEPSCFDAKIPPVLPEEADNAMAIGMEANRSATDRSDVCVPSVAGDLTETVPQSAVETATSGLPTVAVQARASIAPLPESKPETAAVDAVGRCSATNPNVQLNETTGTSVVNVNSVATEDVVQPEEIVESSIAADTDEDPLGKVDESEKLDSVVELEEDKLVPSLDDPSLCVAGKEERVNFEKAVGVGDKELEPQVTNDAEAHPDETPKIPREDGSTAADAAADVPSDPPTHGVPRESTRGNESDKRLAGSTSHDEVISVTSKVEAEVKRTSVENIEDNGFECPSTALSEDAKSETAKDSHPSTPKRSTQVVGEEGKIETPGNDKKSELQDLASPKEDPGMERLKQARKRKLEQDAEVAEDVEDDDEVEPVPGSVDYNDGVDDGYDSDLTASTLPGKAGQDTPPQKRAKLVDDSAVESSLPQVPLLDTIDEDVPIDPNTPIARTPATTLRRSARSGGASVGSSKQSESERSTPKTRTSSRASNPNSSIAHTPLLGRPPKPPASGDQDDDSTVSSLRRSGRKRKAVARLAPGESVAPSPTPSKKAKAARGKKEKEGGTPSSSVGSKGASRRSTRSKKSTDAPSDGGSVAGRTRSTRSGASVCSVDSAKSDQSTSTRRSARLRKKQEEEG